MPRVILQPASMDHFAKTVRNPVSLTKVTPLLLEEDARSLASLYPNGSTRIWGVTPGEEARNARKWERFEADDVVLFCANKRAFASAFVRYKLRSAALARALWGVDDRGYTWEYVYFVSAPALW